MATGTTTKRGADRWIVVGTDWAGYRAMQKIRGERSYPRIIYLDGRMTLVSPGFSHEIIRKRLGTLIEEVAVGLKMTAVFAGSTTLWRKLRKSGVEGDEVYYFANAHKIVGKKTIDMRIDPPPDLAIEAVVSHPVNDAIEVYRRLGVPEVWVCDGRKLRIMVLQADQTYAQTSTSVSLPMLTADVLLNWVQNLPDADDVSWRVAVRLWVATELAPPHNAGNDEPKPA